MVKRLFYSGIIALQAASWNQGSRRGRGGGRATTQRRGQRIFQVFWRTPCFPWCWRDKAPGLRCRERFSWVRGLPEYEEDPVWRT